MSHHPALDNNWMNLSVGIIILLLPCRLPLSVSGDARHLNCFIGVFRNDNRRVLDDDDEKCPSVRWAVKGQEFMVAIRYNQIMKLL